MLKTDGFMRCCIPRYLASICLGFLFHRSRSSLSASSSSVSSLSLSLFASCSSRLCGAVSFFSCPKRGCSSSLLGGCGSCCCCCEIPRRRSIESTANSRSCCASFGIPARNNRCPPLVVLVPLLPLLLELSIPESSPRRGKISSSNASYGWFVTASIRPPTSHAKVRAWYRVASPGTWLGLASFATNSTIPDQSSSVSRVAFFG
mmetsp:Transcript_8612/g.25504  ORF Transcript_8612/g.25504 Transcript_8612/m.25504 type:complete len:204 (-) Transcript_8612:1060-1671(-)